MATAQAPNSASQVAVTVLVAVLMTEIFCDVRLAISTRLPSGVTAMPAGVMPTGMVAVTVFVAVLMTETLLDPWLTTYAVAPFGVIATCTGLVPTGIVVTTA